MSAPGDSVRTTRIWASVGSDFLNYPYDLAQIWHEASLEHSKNKSILAFCWEKSKSWSKMRLSDEIFGYFFFESLYLATGLR